MKTELKSIKDREIDYRKFPNGLPLFKIVSPSKKYPKSSLNIIIDYTTSILLDDEEKSIQISRTDACGSVFTEKHFFANWGRFPDDVSIELVKKQLNKIEEELKRYQ